MPYKSIDQITETTSLIAMKWHVIIGFITGSGPFAFLVDRWQDVLLAFFLGAATALGSALIKIIADKLRKKKNKNSLP